MNNLGMGRPNLGGRNLAGVEAEYAGQAKVSMRYIVSLSHATDPRQPQEGAKERDGDFIGCYLVDADCKAAACHDAILIYQASGMIGGPVYAVASPSAY